MERVPIVDSNDEIIDYKNRDELDYRNDIVRSSSLWITNSMGQVLLAQRKLTKKTNPGKWSEAVGGTVANDDDYEATVYREAEEELGIVNEVFAIGPKQFVNGPPQNYFVQWYEAKLDWPIERFKPQEEEVEKIEWFDTQDLKRQVSENSEKFISEFEKILDLF